MPIVEEDFYNKTMKRIFTRRLLKYPTLIFIAVTLVISFIEVYNVVISSNFININEIDYSSLRYITFIVIFSLVVSIILTFIGFVLSFAYVFWRNKYTKFLILSIVFLYFCCFDSIRLYFFIPFVLCLAPLNNINTSLIENLLDTGASNFTIIRKYIFKSVFPQLTLSFIIIFVLSFREFGVIQLPIVLVAAIIIHKYFDKHKDKLYVPVNRSISKYKCIPIGKEPYTIIGITLLFLLLCYPFVENINILGFSISDYDLLISVISALCSIILGAMSAISASGNKQLRQHNYYKTNIILLLFVGYILHFIPPLIAYTFVGTIFSSIFIFRKIRQLDKNIENAALDLGANNFQTLIKVSVPALLPSIISTFLIIMLLMYSINNKPELNLINILFILLVLFFINPIRIIDSIKI
jgi:ABC-type spermidine/putrescine transport system permease subunit II